MTRYEFISGLKNALENELNSGAVQEHVNYYNDYINGEIRNGRSEADVIAELGDPWVIAKTIIASEEAGSTNGDEYSYVSSDYESQDNGRNANPNIHVFGLDKWWKKLLLILGIIGIIMIVFSIITGFITLVAPFIVPILIISFVLKRFRKK